MTRQTFVSCSRSRGAKGGASTSAAKLEAASINQEKAVRARVKAAGQRHAQIKALYRQGRSIAEIAEEIGITAARTRVILGARLNVAKATQARAARKNALTDGRE